MKRQDKDSTIKFRCTKAERDDIEAAAALIGQTISGWIRNEAVWAARAALDSKRRQRKGKR